MPDCCNMSEQTPQFNWITLSGRQGSYGSSSARYPYWSFTKTVLAICALKLVEAGTLDLDSQLDGQIYTLRQLLNHTSGVPNYGQLQDYHAAVAANDPAWSREKLLERAFANGTLFQPGQGWSYSNIGYMFIQELIEESQEKSFAEIVLDMVCQPLGLKSIELAQTRQQFAQLHWKAAASYDPLWVYHGCLTGTASDAARLLHTLFTGGFLRSDTLNDMLDARPLGDVLSGRPWTRYGYALGLMSGEVEGAGRAIGHSGAGPFCVNAVYHFPDVPDPVTIACFTEGTDEGVVEYAAAKLAQNL